jgi:hypothetical protein
LLGSFCSKFGPAVFESAKGQVYQLIRTNLDRSDVTDQHQREFMVT